MALTHSLTYYYYISQNGPHTSKGIPMNTQDIKAQQAARKIVVFGLLSGIAFTIYCLFISREHITTVGYAIRLKPFEAETLFILVDFLAMFGKMLTSKKLSAKTRRIGFRWMVCAGSISLLCNIIAGLLDGWNFGEAGYGAGVVALIVFLEYTIVNTKAKTTAKRTRRAPAAPTADLIPSVRISGTGRTCQAGCACKRHARNKVAA